MNEFNHYIEEFNKYVKDYDLSNEKIKLKYDHSLRVMKLSYKYAKRLGFNKEDIELAALIGLLHDIGRFEQLKVYNSFSDTMIDHADYSVEQLFKKKLIKNFTIKEKWYPIIEFAVRNHNKLDIPQIKDAKILKHARLIRDTDILDILVATSETIEGDGSEISKEIMNFIKKHSLIDRRYAKTKSDFTAVQYGFAFNIYYNVVLEEYKNNFIRFHNSIKRNESFKDAYKEVIQYLDERIDIYDRYRIKI